MDCVRLHLVNMVCVYRKMNVWHDEAFLVAHVHKAMATAVFVRITNYKKFN